ncbi:2-hydroxyacid dehydrogenase [Silvimonas iriomotensis]|uniref:Glyoxylate/hydroxypyruvate reductase A n=1 Tax=Silvimonas iriomotensis TaxID=449662 RepID=A0ABQ2P4S3_9NEIS|nr:glyoxylate/hydroxypyruvate reductase A [Silvimonas iriomotensis]GGP18336.1 glyoxylate/hydroxypyruvate reductase A [Silvimonas iriomotensis]
MIYIHTPADGDVWLNRFRQALPGQDIAAFPQPVDDVAVTTLITWRPPEGLFARFANLAHVFALGAGIDRFLQRPDLPPHVQLYRLTDAGMAQQMIEYVLFGVLRFQRNMDGYLRQQRQALWQALPQRAASEVRISVLGMGELGTQVAQALVRLGYPVTGWSRTPKVIDGIPCVHGLAQLDDLLRETDVLVCLLPATPETRNLLDETRLTQLPAGAAIINAGRGELIDLDAMLALLDNGHLQGAQLDVFPQEPLPASHRIWQHPAVFVTPHVAANTLVDPSVAQIAARIKALQRGEDVAGRVDRQRAY